MQERLILTEQNFKLFAARFYDNPECFTEEEFEEDLLRFKYIKRIFRRYRKLGDIDDHNIRLALNHIILVLNMWGVGPGSQMLFFKSDPEHFAILKTFLLYLHSLPKFAGSINTEVILTDQTLAHKLRSI